MSKLKRIIFLIMAFMCLFQFIPSANAVTQGDDFETFMTRIRKFPSHRHLAWFLYRCALARSMCRKLLRRQYSSVCARMEATLPSGREPIVLTFACIGFIARVCNATKPTCRKPCNWCSTLFDIQRKKVSRTTKASSNMALSYISVVMATKFSREWNHQTPHILIRLLSWNRK